MEGKRVSLIVPAYNEEKVIRESVKALQDILEALPVDFEIIISEDGSTDRTLEIAKSMESENVRVVHNEERMGKGASIKNAIDHTRGNIVMFVDADMASDPSHLKQLIEMLDSGAAIVVGSRYLPESDAKRSVVRNLASRSFNTLVRTILGSRLTDHQCGFKAFRKDLVLPVIAEVEDKHWFWDAELLVRAQRKGLKVAEIPIKWSESNDSRFRLLDDTYHMAVSLVRFRLRGR